MLEAKDEEITILNNDLAEQKSILKAKEEEVQKLMNNLTQQGEETQQAKDEASAYKSEVDQLKADSSLSEKIAKKKERQLLQQMEEWEKERNSLRKLFSLAVKRVGRGTRSFVSRLRR